LLSVTTYTVRSAGKSPGAVSSDELPVSPLYPYKAPKGQVPRNTDG